ncbi:pleckstrin homology domain-containing family G member 3-like [Phlebotomus argentipes]|uniref:pleckstrin homology domain-containing family G member 3-like n=1 Tax=Phlebotomus argentipes TaxID=94469 RepID=UPI002893038F|nr:pleckstrin homology domain-containing family G member 3-like [Phlebotomus argentipes]
MDVESDESERWEDFFGSSTDLAPSVIGYYDRLSTEISSGVVIADGQVPRHPEKPKKPPQLLPRPPQTLPQSAVSPRKQFHVLSPTVQRLIASHGGEKVSGDQLRLRKPVPPQKPVLRHCQLQIPLSRNTCKLSAQSGSELVDTYESSRQAVEEAEEQDRHRKSLSSSNEELKTPTNDQEQFNYQEGRVKCLVQRLQSPTAEEPDGLVKDSPETGGDSDETTVKSSPMETCNFFVKLPPDVQEEIDKCRASTRISSPDAKGSYSRTKLLANRPLPGSPKLSEKKSSESPEKGNGLRPLSGSSIYSLSSTSSSSGEEIQAVKLGAATSYLASVESLADHSDTDGISAFGSGLTMCERAVMEIIDSERCYVEDLGQVIRGYLDDWKERACLSLDDLTVLFSNIREIYKFNTFLLESLKSAGRDPVGIAKCFIELNDKFAVYTTYCTSYPNAISLLTSLLQASHTNALLTSTQKLLQHNLPLGSYLLKPVQRILKYHLLLDNLRKHCDVAEVAQAHELMREVARNIDQVKRNLEQQSRVKELSGILDGWLGPELTVLGELRQEGMLMENSKLRAVFLFETMLIITKPKEDNRLQFKMYIKRQDIMLVEHLPGEPTSFNVIPVNDPRHQIKLTAKNREQKRVWAQHIKSVMLEDLNIPNRAKELVFKLGDEEDRTPDKGVGRKWSQSSTPEYLERRNQYRRSEMRYRSKKARKNMTSSASMEGLGSGKVRAESPRRVRSKESLVVPKGKCDHRDENCNCAVVKSQLTDTLKSRERSQSVEKLSSDKRPEDGSEMTRQKKYSTLDGTRKQSAPPVEIKVYTTKTLPTRIVNIKKNKAKAAKETSKFYCDLTNDEPTVLRITESTEKLNEAEEKVDATKEELAKNDAEIISDLLKDSDEYKRIMKVKIHKQKSVDNKADTDSPMTSSAAPSSSSSTSSIEKADKPTEEPLKSQAEKMLDRLKSIESDIQCPEPIYESLLRNVHVPYKSPIGLNRSVSQNYSPKKKSARPESDYVTLVYSGGELQSVDGFNVKSLQQSELLRNSDSNINYNKGKEGKAEDAQEAEQDAEKEGNFERRGSLRSSKSTFLQRFMSVRLDDSMDSTSSIPKCVKKSEITQSFIHKQGSESLGSRIAHVDYADPKTLFIPASQGSGDSSASVKTQRDSVFSLTSSNDSVNDSKNGQLKSPEITEAPASPSLDDEYYYEQKVEACLENDGFFRDSAIYSDDNERRGDFVEEKTSTRCLVAEQKKRLSEIVTQSQTITEETHNGVTTRTTTKNWVMQQIKNFDGNNTHN